MFKSQLESSRIWRTSAFFSTSGRLLPFSRYTVLEPMMLVSGVRRSWEIARSRFARIFSFSASISIFSRSASTRACVFMLLVMALVMPEIENIATKVIGYPAIVKSSAKYGYVNRKLTQTTPTKEENRPKLYPSVKRATKKTARM